MPADPGQAAEVRNWLFICESEVRALLRTKFKRLMYGRGALRGRS